jgi:hypothetical protein
VGFEAHQARGLLAVGGLGTGQRPGAPLRNAVSDLAALALGASFALLGWTLLAVLRRYRAVGRKRDLPDRGLGPPASAHEPRDGP